MTVRIYVRVSTRKQHDSARRQEQSCRDYVVAQQWDDECVVYQDIGKSGALPISERQGLSALVRDLSPRDTVIFEARDRLARNTQVADEFDELCGNLVVRVVSLFEDSSAGARDWLNMCISRTSDAMRQMAAEGRYTGGLVPYGYRVADDESRRLEADPAEQAALAAIRQLRASGLSLRKVARVLEARGMLARSGRRWSAGCLLNVLRDRPTIEGVAAEVEAVALIRALRADGMSLRAIADDLSARGVPCRGERWHQTTFDFGGMS